MWQSYIKISMVRGLIVFEKAEIEDVLEKFKDSKVSVSVAQKEIDKLFLVQKGFFKRLEDNLAIIVTDRISNETSEYLSTSAYLRRQRTLRKELIQKSNWVNFWLACPWLKAPTIEDIETIRSIPESRLEDYHRLICESLRQMDDRDLENSIEASILKSFYLLMTQKIKMRTDMKQPDSKPR
jgi:hypothetical protein